MTQYHCTNPHSRDLLTGHCGDLLRYGEVEREVDTLSLSVKSARALQNPKSIKPTSQLNAPASPFVFSI